MITVLRFNVAQEIEYVACQFCGKKTNRIQHFKQGGWCLCCDQVTDASKIISIWSKPYWKIVQIESINEMGPYEISVNRDNYAKITKWLNDANKYEWDFEEMLCHL
jgi:hypothetical protein